VNYEVGKKVWYVPNGYGHDARNGGRELTVTKVGRKYAELTGEYTYHTCKVELGKVDVESERKGYSSPGRLYASKEEHEVQVQLDKEWSDFQMRLSHIRPTNMTLEAVRKIRELCGLPPYQEKES